MRPEKLLKKGLKELKISPSEAQIEAFMAYLRELKKWNRVYNLTAITEDRDIIIKHFLDSLLYLRALPKNHLKIADFGTGAGFPGIPLKIIRPEIEMALVESKKKKAIFLRHIIRTLGLEGVHVVEQRAEALEESYRGSFDVIVSRATFRILEFLRIACPYIKEEGSLVLSRGPGFKEELKELEKTLHIRLPFSSIKRILVILACKS